MAIDVKNIQVEACRVTKHSVAYVKDHPIILALLPFLFLLYVFLQSLFVFLFFALPVLIFIVVAFRLIFIVHQRNLRNAKGDTYTHDRSFRQSSPSRHGMNLDKRGCLYAHARSVRRRSSKKDEIRVHFQEDMDEKDMVDKACMVEETPKEIREVEVDPMTDRSRPGFCEISGLRTNTYSPKRFGFEGENSDEGEEAPEDRNKGVEWTENDHKNVMDLGLSEIDRNKRLERLIAKRNTRKLLSLQVRRSLMNIGRNGPSNEIATLSVPKTGAFSRTRLDDEFTPGSAPSVMLTMRNPFDIPYDPQEEKPNLTGGFQEELVVAHHKDPGFCRHESFSLGSKSSGPWELDSPSATSHRLDFAIRDNALEIPEFSRFKKQAGKEDPSEPTEIGTYQESEVGEKSGNEKVLVASSQLEKVEDNEPRLREVNEVSKQDIVESGISRINQEILSNLALHENSVDKPEESSNSEKNFSNDKKIVNDINDRVDLVIKNEGTSSQDLSAPTLNEYAKSVDATKGISKPGTYLEEGVERQSGYVIVAEGSDLAGNNNNQIKEIVAEKGSNEASSSTSSGSKAVDKDPSFPLRNTTEATGLINSVNVPRINILSNEGINEQVPVHESSVVNNQVGTTHFNPSLVRPIEPVMFLGIDPTPIAVIPEVAVEQVAEGPSSTSSSPISVLQHKFSVDMMPNMSFDDIQTASQQLNMEVELNNNLSGVGLQESLVPVSHSSEGNTSYSTGDKLVQTSDKRADTGLLGPTNENEYTETIKEDKPVGELQKSKELEGHSKLDMNIGNLESVDVIGSHSGNLVVPKVDGDPDNRLAPKKGNELVKEAKAIEEPQRFKEFEDHPMLNIEIDKSEAAGVIQSHSGNLAVPNVNSDLDNKLAPKKASETINGVKATEELQKSKELVGHSEPDIAIDKTEPVRVIESQSGNLAASKVSDLDNRIAPNKVNETVKGVKGIEELQRSKEVEGHSKVDITNDKSEAVGVTESHSGNLAMSKVKSDQDNKVGPTPTEANETVKGVITVEELKRSKESEGHLKLDTTIDKSESVGVNESRSKNSPVSNVTSDANDKVATEKVSEIMKEVKPTEESPTSKEFGGHPKLDNNKSESEGVAGSNQETQQGFESK